MNFQLDIIEDKIEFFESEHLTQLEKKIAEKIEHNRAIMLGVHSVQHQMHIEAERTYYSAVVHFKIKRK